MSAGDIQRFWSKVDVRGPGECWAWLGAISNTGYGAFYLGGKLTTAHRVAHDFAHGPVPEGLEVMHSCDCRECVNPKHLSAGTRKQNVADMRAKGRENTTGLRGGGKKKDFCLRGHPRTPENLRGRDCIECSREHSRAYRLRKRSKQ